jgi:hypothetical protein
LGWLNQPTELLLHGRGNRRDISALTIDLKLERLKFERIRNLAMKIN